jgi:uncharacterized protein (DUF433 family)
MTWQGIITLEPGKRGGRPCIRHMRITVADVLGWLAAGMTHAEILSDYPELTEEDIRACLSYAADRERGVLTAACSCCSTKTSASNFAHSSRICFPAPNP